MFFQGINKKKDNIAKVTADPICCVQRITQYIDPCSKNDRAIAILDRFYQNPELICLPVVEDNVAYGMINRHRFMEKHMVGKYGFGHSLNYYKSIGNLLPEPYLEVDEDTTIEAVAKLIQQRDSLTLYDDICVTRDGLYLGVVSVNKILNAIMENNLALAIGANPLSGLPGNDFIQRKIRELLSRHKPFDICYIDIDFFKPFNDKHGFALGDEVIKSVAEIISLETSSFENDLVNFTGHIGGDDFILLLSPEISTEICTSILNAFDLKISEFHKSDEIKNGWYESKNRKGEKEVFPLLSLSIAIVSSQPNRSLTYAEISSIASEVKKKAKKTKGSVLVKDMRLE